jgi:hypothetical protein
MACDVPYIIGKLLERRWLKWAHIVHLDIWNTSYGKKKSWESNYQFDSRPLKVRNRPDLLVFRWHATYRWKALDESYNFSSYRISIRGLLAKLWGSKVAGVPTWAISGLPFGSPVTKNHLDVGPVERCRVYYKGEGGGFPQVWAVVNLVCLCCSWLFLTLKVLQLRTNHLVWVLCRPMWVSEACQLFLIPSWSSNMPLYPSKCYELGNVPQLFLFPLFSTWDSHLSLSRSWECVTNSTSDSLLDVGSNVHRAFSNTLSLDLNISLEIKRNGKEHTLISLSLLKRNPKDLMKNFMCFKIHGQSQ